MLGCPNQWGLIVFICTYPGQEPSINRCFGDNAKDPTGTSRRLKKHEKHLGVRRDFCDVSRILSHFKN
jgi:hypothetical protein